MALRRRTRRVLFGAGLCLGLLSPATRAQSDVSGQLRRADTLFATGRPVDAAAIYEKTVADGYPITDAMLLKLAAIYEQQADWPRLLYYLQVYFDRHPDEAVLRKMNDIARANNLGGYETDDLNYFYLFYKQYSIYLLLFLLIPAVYGFGVLLVKRLRKQPIPGRQKWVMLFYLIGMLVFANLPEVRSGITSRDRVLLRTDPSAAAPVAEVIGRGHKLNILGSRDIYIRVLWHNELYYVRRDNVWII